MCNEIMGTTPDAFHRIPDHFKTQEMCIKTVEVDPWQLEHVTDHFKTQEICNKAVRMDPQLLNVPDWFVTQQQIKSRHDDDYYCDDSKLVRWHDGYQKRKTQKAKIKEELMPIAWYPNRVMDWCMSEDEKRCWM